MEERIDSLLSRKFLFSAVSVLLAYTLVLSGKVEPKEFFNFVEIMGGAYILGNVATKIIK